MLGARECLVGVDDASAKMSDDVAGLPLVGGLFNPSLEMVVALRPDVVVLVPSVEQRSFRERLDELGVRVEVFQNHRFDEVMSNIAQLGELVGRQREARERIERVKSHRAAVAVAVAKIRENDARSARTILILQREPLFVVGSKNFIDAMLVAAGGENVAASFDEPYPRVAMEWLISQGPEILIDLSPGAPLTLDYWRRWPAIPAVASNQLRALDPALISMPGAYLDRTLDVLAKAIWGDGFTSVPPSNPRASR